MQIDLNADLGEGMGDDAAMLDVVTSANVACGGHAGDAASMRAVCRAAVARGARIGAHLSYPDVVGFGRVAMDLPTEVLMASLRDQLDQLTTAALAEGGRVTFVKPHGALYHRVAGDPEVADLVVSVARPAGLAVVGLPGSVVLRRAAAAGLVTIPEAFADRGYLPDGGLVPRDQPGAVLRYPELVASRMVGLVRDGAVAAVDGTMVAVTARSICVHSDTPGAVAIARAVRAGLVAAGVQIAAVT
ncbi:5-oxoprolinase subunit PxpA [Pseudactinotalea suaedae]|uniref:5-oxoprolinase subunit PxpA n=1 Tax=Pseudactinotalea suaedae TaxID=1524924 RepID=UPI001F4F901C|nr:5-oxoprolinase subunit PxpA [Pseudactinotalea suaedae]